MGRGYQVGNRLGVEERTRMAMRLSDRHHAWGQDCPAVDLDFMMCEYNHGISVALVDYKHHRADIYSSNDANYRAMSELYLKDGRQIPLFIAKYWPDDWAFRTRAVNESAVEWASGLGLDWDGGWRDQTEQQFVRMLYRLRKDALTQGDERTIARLNTIKPPPEDDGRTEADIRTPDPLTIPTVELPQVPTLAALNVPEDDGWPDDLIPPHLRRNA